MLWHCFRTAVTGAVYSMKNINMIGGGLVSSQTTASLIYDYERKIIWFTEGPDPEMQVFKPLNFNVPATIEDEEVQLRQGVRRWKWNNLLFRAALKDYSVNKDKNLSTASREPKSTAGSKRSRERC